jgi:vancomycin resistance protein VanJ
MKHNASWKQFARRMGRAVRNVAWWTAGVYGVVMTLWAGLKLFDAAWPPVEMISIIVPLLLLPSLVIVPLGLWRRRWLLSLMSLPALLVFLLGYGGFFLPHYAPITSATPPLRFLTYNVHAEDVHVESILEIIREANADVVALQEVSPVMAEALAAQLIDRYPYQALHPNLVDPIWGQGVLSRYPIVEDEYWHIFLGHQRVKIDRAVSPLVLYNVHPVHPFRLRGGWLFDMQPHRAEVDEILGRVALDTGAVIVAGDFNMTDQNYDYQRLAQHLGDAYREVGWGLGFTFPDFTSPQAQPIKAPIFSALGRPLARIDLIFHSGDLQPVAAQVWPTSGGSDHRPVLAEFSDDASTATAARP